MNRSRSLKRLAHLVFSLVMLFSLLLPTTAFAQSRGNANQKNDPPPAAQKQEDDKKATSTSSAPAPQAEKKDEPKREEPRKEEPKPAPSQQSSNQTTAQQSNTRSAVQTDDKKADQQAAKQVEQPRGHSLSNPDGGGVDKPYAVGDQKANSQNDPADTKQITDGNNGCGQDRKGDADRETGTRHLGYDDNNGWCGRPHDVLGTDDDTPNPPCTVNCDNNGGDKHDKEEPKLVHVKGCFKGLGEVDQWMTEAAADKFLKDNERISCGDVKGSIDEVARYYVCHRTGSDKNPWVLIEVSVNAQGHLRTDSHEPLDLHPQDRVFKNGLPAGFTVADCGEKDTTPPPPPGGNNNTESFSGCILVDGKWQQVTYSNISAQKKAEYQAMADAKKCEGTLGTTDTNPGGGGDNPQPVNLYGCYRKPDGTYQHYSMTFSSQAEKDAFERTNGLTVDASRPTPDQCKDNRKDEKKSDNPPAEVRGIQIEADSPVPVLLTTIAMTEVAPEAAPAEAMVITPMEARDQSPVVDVFPPARELGITSEQPAAPAAQQVISPVQPAPQQVVRPTTTLLPTTGEPLVDLALLTLGFVGLTFLGLRFLRAGVRRA